MKQGDKVKVKIGTGQYHIGEYLGTDEVFEDVHLVGVLETTIDKNLKPKDGKKYISIFRAKGKKQLEVIK